MNKDIVLKIAQALERDNKAVAMTINQQGASQNKQSMGKAINSSLKMKLFQSRKDKRSVEEKELE